MPAQNKALTAQNSFDPYRGGQEKRMVGGNISGGKNPRLLLDHPCGVKDVPPQRDDEIIAQPFKAGKTLRISGCVRSLA